MKDKVVEEETIEMETQDQIDNLEDQPVDQLLKSYEATLSQRDRKIYDLLQMNALKGIPIESMPLFGEKMHSEAATARVSNPLQAHSIRANAILTSLDDQKAFNTALQYDAGYLPVTSDFYDIRFLLPLLCHVLDEKNICNELKVISNGWVYFIFRGMSLEDDVLRQCGFLALQRLILSLQRQTEHRKNDNRLWLQITLGIRDGINSLGKCKISNLMSTWLVSSWEVLKQPSHPLYRKLISAVLAKQYIDMTLIPDFVTFYNPSDGKRESRDWMLNVFFYGLKKKDDWELMEKLPALKFFCSSFQFEKVQAKRTILKILTRISKEPQVAIELVDKYSIPLWIANITPSSNAIMRDLENFYRVLANSINSIDEGGKDEGDNVQRNIIFDYVCKKQGWKSTSEIHIES